MVDHKERAREAAKRGWSPPGVARTVSQVVGRNVSYLRQEAGLTQEELAAAMTDLGFGWRRQTVTEVEAGHRPVSIEELAAVSALFDMPPEAVVVAAGLVPGPSTGDAVSLGKRVLSSADWISLWNAGPVVKPPARERRVAIDRLTAGMRRPWARLWRRSRGQPAPAFAQARKEAQAARSRHPGPTYMSQEDVDVRVVRPLWMAKESLKLRAGVPYVARDELEADALGKEPGVQRISRQAAYRLRKGRADEGGR